MSDDAFEDFGGYHPLFLPLDGASSDDFKPEQIRLVRVYKLENNRRINRATFDPRGADAPRSEEDLNRAYGAGSFEIVAHRLDGTIYARRRYDFADPSGAPAPAGGAELAPGMPQLGGQAGLLMVVLQLMQKASDDSKQMLVAMMQQQQASADRQTQMLVAAMGMQQNAGAAGQSALANVLGQVISAKTVAPPQADPVKSAQAVLELAKTFKATSGETNWAELIGGVLAGLGAMAQQQQQQQAGAPQTQPPLPQSPPVIDTTATPLPPNGIAHA